MRRGMEWRRRGPGRHGAARWRCWCRWHRCRGLLRRAEPGTVKREDHWRELTYDGGLLKSCSRLTSLSNPPPHPTSSTLSPLHHSLSLLRSSSLSLARTGALAPPCCPPPCRPLPVSRARSHPCASTTLSLRKAMRPLFILCRSPSSPLGSHQVEERRVKCSTSEAWTELRCCCCSCRVVDEEVRLRVECEEELEEHATGVILGRGALA